jgi:hypothetical protein
MKGAMRSVGQNENVSENSDEVSKRAFTQLAEENDGTSIT